MPHPKNKMKTPGHHLVTVAGLAACSCGWTPGPVTEYKALQSRAQHLVDVRMDLLP